MTLPSDAARSRRAARRGKAQWNRVVTVITRSDDDSRDRVSPGTEIVSGVAAALTVKPRGVLEVAMGKEFSAEEVFAEAVREARQALSSSASAPRQPGEGAGGSQPSPRC